MNSPAPTPTPDPDPDPEPDPDPDPDPEPDPDPDPGPKNTTLTGLTMSETFPGATASMSTNLNGDGSFTNTSTSTGNISDQTTIAFDADTDSFILDINQGTVDLMRTFSPASVNEGESDSTFRVHEVGSDTFVLIEPGDPTLNLQFTTFGLWTTEEATPRDIAFGFTVFGVQTSDPDMPTVGSATYTGITNGILSDGGTPFLVSGDMSLTADFGTRSVDATFSDMVKENLLDGGVSLWRDFTGAATIGSGTNLFTGTAETDDGVLDGSFDGAFFGSGADAAEEVGGTWGLGGGGENAVGVFVGGQ